MPSTRMPPCQGNRAAFLAPRSNPTRLQECHKSRNLFLSKRQRPSGQPGSAGWKPCRVRIRSLSKRQCERPSDYGVIAVTRRRCSYGRGGYLSSPLLPVLKRRPIVVMTLPIAVIFSTGRPAMTVIATVIAMTIARVAIVDCMVISSMLSVF